MDAILPDHKFNKKMLRDPIKIFQGYIYGMLVIVINFHLLNELCSSTKFKNDNSLDSQHIKQV